MTQTPQMAPNHPASTLPPTQPTSLPNAVPAQVPDLPHYAHVTYQNDQLEVHADNSSLNQILRSVARLTGLKITGGVQDQRVYGAYGPAPVATILAMLLDGTGTNIFLLEGDATNPPRLILTPRTGGVNPPGPESPVYAAYDNPNETPNATPNRSAGSGTSNHAPQQASQPTAPPQTPNPSLPPSIPQPANDVNGSATNTSPTASTMPTTHSVPLDAVPTPSTTPSTSGIIDAPNPPAPGSTTGSTPNGTALTPEMVAQKLLEMQQQQTSQPASSGIPPQNH